MSPAQIKTEREQAFYREMFIQLLDIVDAITGQMFERISVIPYSIRQFCKCLYQMTIDRFGGPQAVSFEQAIGVVAHYLLDEWLLKACFTNLHIEGLEKERDFYFDKLREIEVLLQAKEETADPLVESIFKILYHTTEDFVAVVED